MSNRPLHSCLGTSAPGIGYSWCRQVFAGTTNSSSLRVAMVVFFLLLNLICVAAPASAGGEKDFAKAQTAFEALSKNKEKRTFRHNWEPIIGRFKATAAAPKSDRAQDSLFMLGKVHETLYGITQSARDKNDALDYYARVIKRYPTGNYAQQARQAAAALRSPKEQNLQTPEPQKQEPGIETQDTQTGLVTGPVKLKTSSSSKNRKVAAAKQQAADGGHTTRKTGPPAKVTDLRYWSTPDYTRVVINVEEEVSYTYALLKKDSINQKPQRLVIDLENSRINETVDREIPIGDELLASARAAQYRPKTVRIVLDINKIDKYKVFSLNNPFRIVFDAAAAGALHKDQRASGKTEGKAADKLPGSPGPAGADVIFSDGALAKQLALGVRRIAIDPGHGGKDCGAVGYGAQLLEKNVTLELGKRLAAKIEEQLGWEVFMTRDKDVFLSLEERTAFANAKNADIFISVHTNASTNPNSNGIETYFLNLATDNDAILVAARENAISEKKISDLHVILNDLMKNAKIGESSRLAGHIQKTMIQDLRSKYGVKDKGVKQAPFYVLLGAVMPSVLVETAFITNPSESQRLNSAAYQDEITQAIVDGLHRYVEEVSPASLHWTAKSISTYSSNGYLESVHK